MLTNIEVMKQTSTPFQSRNPITGVSKKPLKNIFRILFLLFFSMGIYVASNAQTAGCPNCTSSDVKVSGIELLYDKAQCPDSNTVIENAQILVNLSVTSTERYGFYIYYELYIDGKPYSPLYQKKCFPITLVKGSSVQIPLITLPPFLAYQKIEIKNVMTAWDNTAPVNGVYFCENMDGYACDVNTPKCKFYNFGFPAQLGIKPIFWGVTAEPICLGGSANFRIGGTPGAQVNYTMDGVAGSTFLDANGYTTITKPSATSDVSLTIISLGNATCSRDVNQTFVATINTVTNAGSISGGETVCPGGDPVAFGSTAPYQGTGTLAYQWQSKTASTTWADIAGATSATYDAPAGISETTTFRRLAIAVGCSNLPSNEVTVNVTSSTAGSITGDQVICTNSIPAAFTTVTEAAGPSGSTFTYQWQRSTNGVNWSNINNATGASFTETSRLTSNTSYRRAAIVTSNGVNCTVYSNIVSVTLNGINSAGSITGSQFICSGGDATILSAGTTTVNAIGDVTYQWQSSTNNGNTWTNVVGATAESYDPPAGSISSNTQFRRGTAVILNGSTCDNTNTNTVTVGITSLTTAGTVSSNQSLCLNGTPSTFTSSTNASVTGGTLAYKWQTSIDSGRTWTDISGATSSTYASGSLSSTTQFRRVASAINNANVCQTGNSNTVTATINKVDAAGGINANQNICMNQAPATFTSTATATGTGTIAYIWQSSVDSGKTWTNITGATSTTYTASRLRTTTSYRRVASVSASGTVCNSLNTDAVTATVYNVYNAGSILTDQTICPLGDVATLTQGATTVNAVGTVLYQWQSSSDGTNWTNITDATSDSYDPAAGSVTAKTYYRRGAYVVADTRTCSTIYSNNIAVNITTLDSVGSVSSDQIICSGSTPLALASISNGGVSQGSTVYNWQISSDGTTWTNIDGAIDASYAPNTLTQTTLYRRQISSLNGLEICATDYSNALTITVNNVDNAGAISSDQLICKTDTPTELLSNTPASGTGTLTYQWEASTDGGTTWTTIDNAIAETYAPSVLSASTMFRRLANVSANDVACNTQISNPVTVTLASVTSAGDISGTNVICLGSNPAAFTSTAGATNVANTLYYQWQKSGDDGFTWVDIPGATAANFDENKPVWINTLYRRVAMFKLDNGTTCESLNSNFIKLSTKECEKCTLLNEYTKGFPNPYKYNFTLKFSSCVSGTATIELFDFKGGKLQVITIPNVIAGEETRYNVYLPTSLTGVIYKISIGEYSTVGRMISAQ